MENKDTSQASDAALRGKKKVDDDWKDIQETKTDDDDKKLISGHMSVDDYMAKKGINANINEQFPSQQGQSIAQPLGIGGGGGAWSYVPSSSSGAALPSPLKRKAPDWQTVDDDFWREILEQENKTNEELLKEITQPIIREEGFQTLGELLMNDDGTIGGTDLNVSVPPEFPYIGSGGAFDFNVVLPPQFPSRSLDTGSGAIDLNVAAQESSSNQVQPSMQNQNTTEASGIRRHLHILGEPITETGAERRRRRMQRMRRMPRGTGASASSSGAKKK